MNKTAKQVFRVLGVIASILLSIVLVAMLIIAPVYSVAKSLVRPQNITQIIRDIDYAELLLDSGAVDETLGEFVEVAPELKEHMETYVKPIMQSPIMEEVVEIYAEDVAAILDGSATAFTLNEQLLSDIASKHMDQVIDIVRENTPEGTTIPEDVIRQKVSETVDTYGSELIAAMPDVEEVKEMVSSLQQDSAAALVLDTSVPYILYGAVALIAVLIFFCLYGGGRGLLCLGIDSVIAALVLFALCALLGENGIVASLVGAVPGIGTVLMSAISLVGSKTLVVAIIVTVVGVLLIAGYVTWVVLKKKRAAADVSKEALSEPAVTAEETLSPSAAEKSV